eukprot:2277912-Pleurochrysis_carterae.AAC.1
MDAESARILQLGPAKPDAAESSESESETTSNAAEAEDLSPYDPVSSEQKQVRLAIRSSFQYRFIDCVQCLLDHWAFVTKKRVVFIAQREGVTIEERTRLRDEAEKLGRA